MGAHEYYETVFESVADRIIKILMEQQNPILEPETFTEWKMIRNKPYLRFRIPKKNEAWGDVSERFTVQWDPDICVVCLDVIDDFNSKKGRLSHAFYTCGHKLHFDCGSQNIVKGGHHAMHQAMARGHRAMRAFGESMLCPSCQPTEPTLTKYGEDKMELGTTTEEEE